MSVDEHQLKAIQHGEGPMLVIAGPGSGKTTVITKRIQYLINHLGVSPEEILVITFTKAAALEMQERFLKLINEEYSPVTFGTFHAVFYQILKQNLHFGPNSIIKQYEKEKFLQTVIRRNGIEETDDEFLENLLGEFACVKLKNLKEDEFESQVISKENFNKCFKEYEEEVNASQKVDFEDMILKCHRLLSEREDLRRQWQERFRFILIDEFQDINQMQYETVKMLCREEGNLFAVGDEDQSIYGFRGSAPTLMFAFLKDFPKAQKLMLTVNYRSVSSIVKVAGKLISNNKERFTKEIRPAKIESKEEGVQIKSFLTREEEHQFLVQQILELKKQNRLKEAVVLYRTNSQAELLIEFLVKSKISFQVRGKRKNIYETFQAKDISAYMELAKGIMTRSNLFRIMNRPLRYFSRAMVEKENFTWEELERGGKQKPYLMDKIRKLRYDLGRIRNMSPFAAINYIRKAIGYDEFLVEYAFERGVQKKDYLECMDDLQQRSKQTDSWEEWKSLQEEYKRTFTQDTAVSEKKNAILITTMHSSKGLEWPIVFVPDMIEGVIPHKKAISKEDLEEERRMLYVAITRAKEKVYLLSLSKNKENKIQPSRFYRELGGE